MLIKLNITDEKEIEAIEELKRLFETKTNSKAVLMAAMKFMELVNEKQHFRNLAKDIDEELDVANCKLLNLQNAIKDVLEHERKQFEI
ncbi:MAG: hypothetical protein AAGJ37_13420 [Pseudomonadota bacterium]